MKKVAFLTALLVFSYAYVLAAPAPRVVEVTHTRVVSATQNTALTYAGVNIFVPRGQTIILGQQTNGSIVIRGMYLLGVRVGDVTLFSRNAASVSYNPKRDVVTVNYGEVHVTDRTGNTVLVTSGQSVSARNSQKTTKQGKIPARAFLPQDFEEEELPLQYFAPEVDFSYEQAVQDIEETLSPSAPR